MAASNMAAATSHSFNSTRVALLCLECLRLFGVWRFGLNWAAAVGPPPLFAVVGLTRFVWRRAFCRFLVKQVGRFFWSIISVDCRIGEVDAVQQRVVWHRGRGAGPFPGNRSSGRLGRFDGELGGPWGAWGPIVGWFAGWLLARPFGPPWPAHCSSIPSCVCLAPSAFASSDQAHSRFSGTRCSPFALRRAAVDELDLLAPSRAVPGPWDEQKWASNTPTSREHEQHETKGHPSIITINIIIPPSSLHPGGI